MKKKSWSDVSKYFFVNTKIKKLFKKKRSKARRKITDHKCFEKTTDAWELD